MNFMEAVKALKEGKKVKRPNFVKGYYHYNDNGRIKLSGDNEPILPDIFFFEATDWEVVEENKTLKDKIKYINDNGSGFYLGYFRFDNVKEATQRFFNIARRLIRDSDHKYIDDEFFACFGWGIKGGRP